MARTEQTKEEFMKQVNDVETLRDQIRVDLHLASMDVREEWNRLEKKLPDLGLALKPLESATRDALATLINELRGFGARLRDGARRPPP